MTEYLGFKWLSDALHIDPVQPFQVQSRIGSTRETITSDGAVKQTFPAQFRPEPTVRGHLVFAFKYEVIHIEFLSRLFHAIAPAELENWIRESPTGQYARRACFFYEWTTGRRLDVADVAAGNYVDALPKENYLTATRPSNHPRWRVRDNLPGTVEFCPLVHRNADIAALEEYDCGKALHGLEIEFGADLLRRSAVWLTVKESRASFAIEHEEQQRDRIQRFAVVMEARCGEGPDPLEIQALTDLQRAMLGLATRYGMRKSPVFVGHSGGYANVVDYIAPHWQDTEGLLRGLRGFVTRTVGAAPLLRCAVTSFGFVYIHPMIDGNGRISRFLVNDILRRDGAVPAPFILPISATITNSANAKAGYDRALERFSRPLMQRYANRATFGDAYRCEDGVTSNFHFDGYEEALPAWRYPDLTYHVQYLGDVIRLTIEQEMGREAMVLQRFERARVAVKNHLEGPNPDVDRIIRSVRDNGWRLSNKLEAQFPQLSDPVLADKVVSAVKDAYTGQPDHGVAEDPPG
jgi:hypothetical protein